jgi:hypothetical protein
MSEIGEHENEFIELSEHAAARPTCHSHTLQIRIAKEPSMIREMKRWIPIFKVQRTLSELLALMSPSPLTSLPILSALIDEASRVATTIWILPWMDDTVVRLIEVIAFIRQVFLHFAI